ADRDDRHRHTTASRMWTRAVLVAELAAAGAEPRPGRPPLPGAADELFPGRPFPGGSRPRARAKPIAIGHALLFQRAAARLHRRPWSNRAHSPMQRAITLRWISLVPPPIVPTRASRNSICMSLSMM